MDIILTSQGLAMQTIQIKLSNKLGLHARASSQLIKKANRFSSEININYQGKCADAKSIMDVMMLGAAYGSELTISAEGSDETAAIEALSQLINAKFGEEQ